MKEKSERQKAREIVRRVGEKYGWRVYCDDGDGFELEKWSPAGEDIILSASGGTVREVVTDFRRAADAFDPDEHAGSIFLCKRRGSEREKEFYAAAPDDLRELLKDAKWIDCEQRKVAYALCRAAGVKLPKVRRTI